MPLLLRACPRCHGDIVRDEDEGACLQCGWRGYTVDSAVEFISPKREGRHLGPRSRVATGGRRVA